MCHISLSHPLQQGCPKALCWGISSLQYTLLPWVKLSTHTASHITADDAELYLLFPPVDPTILAPLSKSLQAWPLSHPGESISLLQYKYQNCLLISHPIQGCEKSGCYFWWPAILFYVASVSLSCNFTIYSVRKIRLNLTQYINQLLVRAMGISDLNYCNACLVALPSCPLKHLEMVQKLATHGLPNGNQITVACLQSHIGVCTQILELSHIGLCSLSAPAFLQECCLALPSLYMSQSQSRLFLFVVPLW